MSRLGFSLIELVLVIFLIGLVSFFVIKLPEVNKKYAFSDLRELLYPNGDFYIFEDGSNLVIKDKNYSIPFSFSKIIVYDFDFNKKSFKNFNGKKVVFHYKVRNGIGESFVVFDKKYYVFKPFWVLEFSSKEGIKEYFETLRDVY